MNEWNPRQEIISAAHRWYWIAASILIGALLGWIVGFIWPAPFRASVDLYVGLNAHRATRNLYFAEVTEESLENLDDYKHWQMSQLNALVLSDEYLAETLKRLQIENPIWQEFEVPTLRDQLTVSWRNTGEWHFSALMEEPILSAQAVNIWIDVVVEKTNELITAARRLTLIVSELNAISGALVSAQTRQNLLLETKNNLEEWQSNLNQFPDDQPVSSLDHWSILAQVSITADWSPGWIAALEAAPSLGTFPIEYLNWLTQVIALMDAELAELPKTIEALNVDFIQLTDEYKMAADQSRALAGNFEVAKIKAQPPEVDHLRPTGTLMLIGGLFGLMILIIGWVIQITRKTER